MRAARDVPTPVPTPTVTAPAACASQATHISGRFGWPRSLSPESGFGDRPRLIRTLEFDLSPDGSPEGTPEPAPKRPSSHGLLDEPVRCIKPSSRTAMVNRIRNCRRRSHHYPHLPLSRTGGRKGDAERPGPRRDAFISQLVCTTTRASNDGDAGAMDLDDFDVDVDPFAPQMKRSEGLFNLKIDENEPPATSGQQMPPQLPPQSTKEARPRSRSSSLPRLMTPGNAGNLAPPPKPASLKRPHPFGSHKPSFLMPGSPMTSSPAIQSPVASRPKRFHVPASQTLPPPALTTPDSSFKGAKPLQTAFTSSGLVSKTDQRPRPLTPHIPETPYKTVNSSASFGSSFESAGGSLNPGNPMATPDMSNRIQGPVLNLGERMERFSLSHVPGSMSPGTPTREREREREPREPHALHTSTPMSFPVAGRQASTASTITATPGTVRARRNMLEPLDSLEPLESTPCSSSDPSSSPHTPGRRHYHRQRQHALSSTSSSTLSTTSTTSTTSSGQAGLSTNATSMGSLSSESSPKTPGARITHGPGVRIAGQTPVLDLSLARRFDSAVDVGTGEFSSVFLVSSGKQRFAVKRTKRPGELRSRSGRQRFEEEVALLRRVSHVANPADAEDERRDHVVHLLETWEAQGFGYIMTDYCENGDLAHFLAEHGSVSRLEEWRVWKILAELTLGLSFIHSRNILHLDLKPANVFVTFEGQLKIGDFGMATAWPATHGLEREGDREYIAPEVLEHGEYNKPADVFSLGIMMVEVAANIVLPDNGIHWQRLRSGDLSDAGRLSSGDLRRAGSSDPDASNGAVGSSGAPQIPGWAPQFLVDDSHALDIIVSAMLSPVPAQRPTAEQLLHTPEVALVNTRRQAGAVVYEGEFGPAPYNADEPAWRP